MNPPNGPSFWDELRRRRVVRAVLAYGIVAWIVVQVADVFFPALRLPDWSLTLVAALAVLGFPVTVVLAWTFDRTSEGLERTGSEASAAGKGSGSRLDRRFLAAIGLGMVIGLVVVGAGTMLRAGGEEAGDDVASVAPSVAVLPFEDMSQGQDQEWFGQGIAEEILNALANVDGLAVAARTSSFRYAVPGLDIPAIGDSLGVATVLEGSVRRTNGRVRITAQLVGTDRGLHLWSESFDRELTAENVLDVQEEIAREIARRLTGTLQTGGGPGGTGGDSDGRLTRRHTGSLPAYELFLRGRYMWNQRTEETVGEAIRLFRQAVDADPTYAEAWAALAEAYATPAAPFAPNEALPRAKAAAEQALAIDSSLAPAHTARAYALMNYDYDWAGSEAAFRRAIAADPGYATAHQWYAEHLAAVGELERAIEEVRKAEALDPLSMIIGWNVARILSFDGQHETALRQLLKVQRIHGTVRGPTGLYGTLRTAYEAGQLRPGDSIAVAGFEALVRELEGDDVPRQAIRRFEQTWARDPRLLLEGELLSAEGDRVPMFRPEAADRVPEGEVGAAWLYVWTDAVNEMFDRLRSVTAERNLSGRLVEFAAGPALDPLRDDPRYRAWLESVGLSDIRR